MQASNLAGPGVTRLFSAEPFYIFGWFNKCTLLEVYFEIVKDRFEMKSCIFKSLLTILKP